MKLKNGADIRDLLSDVKQAPKGNVICTCPWCDSRKMYVQTDENAIHPTKGYLTYGTFHCKKCSQKGGLFKLLYKIGQIDLLEGRRVDINADLTKLFVDDRIIEAAQPLPTIKMPPLFERQTSNTYLDSRKLTRQHYRDYCCGVVCYSFKYRDYVYIGMYQDRELKAYMGRYIGTDRDAPRYNNSKSNFGQILGGFDQVGALTKTIILTEGFFDKVAIDEALNLNNKFDTKCLHLNGKSISDTQMIKLLSCDSVQHIIFALDPEAISEIKMLGGQASNFFPKVSGVVPTQYDQDWSSLPTQDVRQALTQELKPIEEFQRRSLSINFSKFRI